jgi:NADH dehydrogenase
LPGHPEIFIIGDLANYSHQGAGPLPGLAPVAMQQGAYAAQAVCQRRAAQPLAPFRYHDRGTMATIGRAKAVADIRGRQFTGLLAWFMWLTVHLMSLVQFQNRMLVFMQWAWNYTTRNAPARLITGKNRVAARTSETPRP